MTLNKTEWQQKDIPQFLKHLETFKRSAEKCKWEQNIINTQYDCLGILSQNIKNISKEIAKGNFISFLELQAYNNCPAITIMGNLICKIKDFDIQKHYLDLYRKRIDRGRRSDSMGYTGHRTPG